MLSSIPEGACACGAEGPMASIGPVGPRCQGLCRKVASLRSGGRRLAVRIAMEHPIGALPRTPFPASRDFAPVGSMSLDSRVAWLPYESSSFATSRGNERYEEKNGGVICFMYYSSISPFGGWRHHLSAPLGSVSLDSQSPTAPCESSSLATPAVRWGGKRKAP